MTKLISVLNIVALARRLHVLVRDKFSLSVSSRCAWALTACTALMLTLPLNQAYAGSVSYSYDALGRLVKAVYSGSISTTVTYSYDAAGNWTAVTTTAP